jgi:protein gp37
MKWWDKSWNPAIGCTKCAPACDNCYAEAQHTARHNALVRGVPMAPCYTQPFDKVRNLSERLDQPLHWRKPLRIFVGNMGDLFHESVTDEQLDQIFATMAMASSAHTFMLCTKRPERMAEYLGHEYRRERIFKASGQSNAFCLDWPLPNVWLGTTVWDQASADRAVPLLLSTPAAKRFVSVEPMLGPVKLEDYLGWRGGICPDCCGSGDDEGTCPTFKGTGAYGLDWVICGGETGSGARPMHPDWARSLRDQCQAAQVPFFFKQWGEFGPSELRTSQGMTDHTNGRYHPIADPTCKGLVARLGRTKAGRVLDGQEWSEVPS